MDTIVETSREYYKSSTSSSGGDTLHPGQEQVRLVNFDMLSMKFVLCLNNESKYYFLM